eukprot:s2883_g12.t1
MPVHSVPDLFFASKCLVIPMPCCALAQVDSYEVRLSKNFESSIERMNRELPENYRSFPILYRPFDMKNHAKSNPTIYEVFARLAESVVTRVGFFHTKTGLQGRPERPFLQQGISQICLTSNMQTNRAPQLASLYVGDLHPDVTEAMLYELFNPVGPVASIRICRDKTTRKSLGYGYVNFHNVKDAETALDSLSYASIHGRSCRLMWSQRDAGQRKANNSNVYVANLDKNIDNKALHDTFSVFGEIRSCKVAADLLGNSFGYGFVHFETEEAAKDAIERLNNVEVGGQKIQVCMCENRKEGAPNSAEDFTNLYVKCFPSSWDEEAVRCEFSKFGRLTGIAVRTDAQGRRSAFVNFELHEDARRCVQEMHMKDMRGPEEQDTLEEVGSDGHPLSRLYVQRAQPKSERERILKKQFAEDAALKNPSKISLYVKGLHEDITDEDLRKLFEPFGHVLSASAPCDANGKCRGFGFVNFGSLEEATKAVSQMHLRVVHGRPIHVDLAESKKDRQARQQRSQRFGTGRGMPGARFPGAMGSAEGAVDAPPGTDAVTVVDRLAAQPQLANAGHAVADARAELSQDLDDEAVLSSVHGALLVLQREAEPHSIGVPLGSTCTLQRQLSMGGGLG